MLLLLCVILLQSCKSVASNNSAKEYETMFNQNFTFNKTVRLIPAFSNEEVIRRLISTDKDIPQWLSGTLVRAGLMPVQIDNKTVHWFDEPSMLHAFSFENGKVFYTNKFLRTDAYKKNFYR